MLLVTELDVYGTPFASFEPLFFCVCSCYFPLKSTCLHHHGLLGLTNKNPCSSDISFVVVYFFVNW